jgi:hypothetical protein
MIRVRVAFVLAAMLLTHAAWAADAPEWLLEVKGVTDSSASKAPAYFLLRERSVEVQRDGRTTTVHRTAVRIQDREGYRAAAVAAFYVVGQSKVRDMRAWVLRPSGEVVRYLEDRAIDMAAATNDVYSEVRVRVLSAMDAVEPGAVFGGEWTLEDRPMFGQLEWPFQWDQWPTRLSRFALTVPDQWSVDALTFNHAPVEARLLGGAHTWELRDLPRIEDEPSAPPFTNLAPRLAVSYYAASGSAAAWRFARWQDVSRWMSELTDPQAALDEALTRKSAQLTAGTPGRLDRVRSISRYVQGIQYISIQTGLGRGGGYRPHAASEVLARSYGDCKDKSNLMRALLAAAGIPSHLVNIWSGDATYVREEWPTPQQFNHCILAIDTGGEPWPGPVVKLPTLGALLLFDPTDPHTPLGDLPQVEQGSLALVIAGDAGTIVRVPVLPADSNRFERETDVTLASDGSITAELHERSTGQAAVGERQFHSGSSPGDYVKAIESWIARGASGAVVSQVTPTDEPAAGRFKLDVRFAASRYAKPVQRLLVFKPKLVSRRESVFPTGKERQYPIVLEARSFGETVRVRLPEDFAVDELPAPVALEESFGTFDARSVVENGVLRFTRRMSLKSSTIPVKDYARVRGFFLKVRASDQSSVVLAKK